MEYHFQIGPSLVSIYYTPVVTCNRTSQVVNRFYLMHQSFYSATIVTGHDSWLITTPTYRKLIDNWQNSSHPIINSWSFWWRCLPAWTNLLWSFIMSIYEIRESQVSYSSLTLLPPPPHPPIFFFLIKSKIIDENTSRKVMQFLTIILTPFFLINLISFNSFYWSKKLYVNFLCIIFHEGQYLSQLF